MGKSIVQNWRRFKKCYKQYASGQKQHTYRWFTELKYDRADADDTERIGGPNKMIISTKKSSKMY